MSTAGFVITLVQVRKTRTAVQAADSASKAALSAIALRLTISELADLRGSIKGAQTALRGARIETALIQLQIVVEQLSALRTRAGLERDEQHTAIQTLVAQLAKLRNQLEERLADPQAVLSIPRANNLLSEINGELSGWSESLRFRAERETS